MYNEYFQWSPENDISSRDHTVRTGDVIYGSVTYDKENELYMMLSKSLSDDWSVETNITIQKENGNYKDYTIMYVVFEHLAPCEEYPPDNQITKKMIKCQI